MVRVSEYKNAAGKRAGFFCIGHAEFAEEGSDIVCAAISVLTMNAVNSIQAFTSDTFSYNEDPRRGMMDFKITSAVSDASALLLDSLFLGLSEIEEAYGSRYIHVKKT